MLGYLGNFVIACGCASAFILPCCIIVFVEKIQDNKEKAKKRAEILAWFREKK